MVIDQLDDPRSLSLRIAPGRPEGPGLYEGKGKAAAGEVHRGQWFKRRADTPLEYSTINRFYRAV